MLEPALVVSAPLVSAVAVSSMLESALAVSGCGSVPGASRPGTRRSRIISCRHRICPGLWEGLELSGWGSVPAKAAAWDSVKSRAEVPK